MSDDADIKFTTETYQSSFIASIRLARLKQRREAELAALTPEARALVAELEAAQTRKFLFGDSA